MSKSCCPHFEFSLYVPTFKPMESYVERSYISIQLQEYTEKQGSKEKWDTSTAISSDGVLERRTEDNFSSQRNDNKLAKKAIYNRGSNMMSHHIRPIIVTHSKRTFELFIGVGFAICLHQLFVFQPL